ncbi:hypothetical protein, partial [Silvanigrella sp.]|uniref:hypothetical protein n=1 Tax=Silvanigrella sp. TaxID=2024976 RepID=UPI0037C62704
QQNQKPLSIKNLIPFIVFVKCTYWEDTRQITTAMTEIDRATQKNQTSATQTSSSANELVDQGEKLIKTTKEIELLILGATKKTVKA